jgi:hypothetical protein
MQLQATQDLARQVLAKDANAASRADSQLVEVEMCWQNCFGASGPMSRCKLRPANLTAEFMFDWR